MKKSVIGSLVLAVLAIIVYCMFFMKRDGFTPRPGFVTPRPGFVTPRPQRELSIIKDLVSAGMTERDASTLINSLNQPGNRSAQNQIVRLQNKYDRVPFTMPPGSPPTPLGNTFKLSQWVSMVRRFI